MRKVGSPASGAVQVVANRFLLHWLEIIILPGEHTIFYNVRYHSTGQFRPPFFVGIRTQAQRQFEQQLRVVLKAQERPASMP